MATKGGKVIPTLLFGSQRPLGRMLLIIFLAWSQVVASSLEDQEDSTYFFSITAASCRSPSSNLGFMVNSDRYTPYPDGENGGVGNPK